MALGPLAEYHILPDSFVALALLIVSFGSLWLAYTGRELAGKSFGAMGWIFGGNLVCFVFQGVPLGGAAMIPSFYVETLTWTSLRPILLVNGYTWWSPVTQMFMHGDLWHIFGNMLFLWLFGTKIEARIGRRAFTVMYVAAGLFAGVLTLGGVYLVSDAIKQALIFDMPDAVTPNIGASGAVYGLIGFSVAAFPKEKVLVPTPILMTWWPAWAAAIFYVLYNLFIGLTGSNVAWWAHLGGMLVGAAWGMHWQRRGRRRMQIDSLTGWGSGGPVRYTYSERR